jgi:hypothetical protein
VKSKALVAPTLCAVANTTRAVLLGNSSNLKKRVYLTNRQHASREIAVNSRGWRILTLSSIQLCILFWAIRVKKIIF